MVYIMFVFVVKKQNQETRDKNQD